LILNTPADGQAGLQVKAITPDSGPSGTLVMIVGSGFGGGTTVTVGGLSMTNLVPSPDGSSIAGLVPPGAGQSDVLVTNPDHTARRAPRQFTYTG
jgi:hypothetical protein